MQCRSTDSRVYACGSLALFPPLDLLSDNPISYSNPPILREEGRVARSAVTKDVMIGDEAFENRNYLQVTQPMEHGIVRNWEDMKLLWDYTFDEKLRVDTRGRKVLLTEPPMNPKVNLQRMAQVMFEEYGAEGVYVSPALSTTHVGGKYARGHAGCSRLTRKVRPPPP